MSEIKLTKKQADFMRWFTQTPTHTFAVPINSRACGQLKDAGLIEVWGTMRCFGQALVRLTESGLAYCKKHFTTTEQP